MKIGSAVKKGIGWLTIIRILYEGIRFGGVASLARLLDPKDFGIMGIVTMVTFFMENLSGFGFRSALIQRKEIKNDHISTVFSVNVITGVVFCLILFFFSSYIGTFFKINLYDKAIAIFSLSLVIRPFSNVPMTILRRKMDFKKYSILSVGDELFALLSAIFFAYIGFGVWSLVYGNLLGVILQVTIILSLRIWFPRFKYSHSAMKDLFSFSGWMFFKNQLAYLTKNIDYFVIGKVLGTTSLGFYERAFSIMMLPYRRMAKSVNAVLFPAFSRIQEDFEYVRLAFRKMVLSISLMSYPIMIGLILVAPEFIQILLGPKWTPVITPLRILCVAGIFSFLGGSITSVIAAQGLAKELVFRESISAVTLVIGVIIGSFEGIVGVSIAVVFYNILRIFLLASLLISRTKIINWSDFLKPQVPPIISSLGMAIGVGAFRGLMIKFTSTHPIIILLSSVILGALIYIGILFMLKFNELDAIKRELLNDIKSIAKRGKLKIINGNRKHIVEEQP